jgi:hypothetical protein
MIVPPIRFSRQYPAVPLWRLASSCGSTFESGEFWWKNRKVVCGSLYRSLVCLMSLSQKSIIAVGVSLLAGAFLLKKYYFDKVFFLGFSLVDLLPRPMTPCSGGEKDRK